MQITKEEFMARYLLTEQDFINAGLTWEEILEIAEDYEHRVKEIFEPIKDEFIEKYFWNKENVSGLQSYRSRCKDSEHLVEKIIRKKNENFLKYRYINKDNYWKFITDLVGVRGLLLYREDWVEFHKYITEEIANDPERYVDNWLKDYVACDDVFMAEAPKVHIRSGDFSDIYVNWIPLDCILDRKHYRSIHYIVNYKGVYIEIQIRTLFEEGWGEIDHDILYPRKLDNPMLMEYSELLNRLSGMGDEMGSFFHRLQKVPDETFEGKQKVVTTPKSEHLRYIKGNSSDVLAEGVSFRNVIDMVVNE